MKNRILFIALMLLMGAQTAVNAQELTVSDIQFTNLNGFSEDFSIVLTKEGSILKVQLLNYSGHPSTQEFVITPKMSGGSDGEPYSVFIDVIPINISDTDVITTFNVSFNVHGIEANSFYFSCWWYKGMVSLTEGEPLELWENKNISKDGVIYTLDNKTKTAALSNGRFVGGEYNILSELDYGGDIFNLTSINYPAFADNSSLTSVIIPKSVTNIGAAAFYRCSNLTDLYCYAENVPTTGINVFTETPIASATLHVPAGSLEKYKATSPWNEFGNIVAMPETNTFIQDIAWVDGFGYEQDGQYKLDDVKLFYYSVAGDTLINGKYYFRIQRKRINKTHCELDVDEYSCETEEDTLCFFMREDEVGDVWFYTENKDVFEKISHNTLYNDYNLADDLICRDLFLFNVKKKYAIGETLPLGMIALDSPNGFREGQDYWDIYPYEVKSIDEMTLLDGKTYKLYNDYILEGIGPLNGPLIGIGTSNSYGLDFNQLFAFFRNGQLIYRNEGYVSALEEYFPNILDIVTGKHQNDPDDNTADSLYGEWWLVGWNDGGDWFEVDTNYVSHQSLSIELKDKKEGPSMAYSIVNEIFVGNLTLNGNEMFFTEGGASTAVYADVNENLFFEEHICDIKSYQLEENQLRLYYTDEDYFVFTNDFDDSEEHHYEWKNGPADPYISEVTAMNDEEVEVKIVQCPSYVTFYSRTTPPHSSSDICRFAMSDLAGLSFEVGDKVAFLITMFKRQKVEKGGEYQLKVEPIEGSEHITNRTGKIHNDSRMGWIIIDDKINEKQGGIYYYPLRKLAEEYLTEGLSVRFSGDLYPTWKTPWDNEGNSDCYYLSIDAINTPHEYFPEGTKWTEIRLDTLKFNSWYSKVGNEWVPNFETIEYRVQGEYDGEGNPYSHDPYNCVYTNSSEWTDSLTFLISEGELNGFPTGVLVTVYDNEIDQPLVPSSYPFEWEVGTMIRFKDILAANMTALFPRDLFDFGVVEEINEAYFGGVRPLKYSDVKGVRMIQGIGVATWNDGECIFGPLKPYDALPLPHEESRHYRSMLVHFERGGEVLYDVWPEKETATAVTYTKDLMATIILPTMPDASKGKYYRLDRCEDNQIIFEQELQPQARVPYVIVPNEDFTIDPSTLNLEGLTQDKVFIEGVSFIGSYHREELSALTGGDGEGSSYIDLIDTTSDCGVTISAETGKEVLFIGALRAYLIVSWDDPINPGGARSPKDKLEIVLKDHKTGVGDAPRLNDKGQMKNDKWYDLQGRQINNSNFKIQNSSQSSGAGGAKLPRGIYIKDKKKVLY